MHVLPVLLVSATLFAACSTPGTGAAVSVEQVQRDVDHCLRAVYRGDVDTVLRYLHPAIVEELGGLEQARAELAPLARQAKTVESFVFPKPPDFLQAGARRFAIVPTLMVLRAGNQRIESLNYQVGVLDPGASGWKYVDGSQISSANVRRLFPDFPADYQFPSFYRRKL